MVSERRISLEDAPIRISYLPLAAYQSCNSVLYHAKLSLIQFHSNCFGFARSKLDFFKAFQFFFRTGRGCCHVFHIELDNFFSCNAACICHIYRNSDGIFFCWICVGNLQIAVCKSSIGESVSEWISNFHLLGIVNNDILQIHLHGIPLYRRHRSSGRMDCQPV